MQRNSSEQSWAAGSCVTLSKSPNLCGHLHLENEGKCPRTLAQNDHRRKMCVKALCKGFFPTTRKGIVEVALWRKWDMCKAFFLKKIDLISTILWDLTLAIRGSLINTLRKYSYAISMSSKWTISLFTVIWNFLRGRRVFKRQITWKIMGWDFLKQLLSRDKRLFLLYVTWTQWFIWQYFFFFSNKVRI